MRGCRDPSCETLPHMPQPSSPRRRGSVSAVKMDVGVSLPRIAIVSIVIVVVLVLALLAWIGGELHYGNCLTKAELEARTPAGGGQALASGETPGSGCSVLP